LLYFVRHTVTRKLSGVFVRFVAASLARFDKGFRSVRRCGITRRHTTIEPVAMMANRYSSGCNEYKN
jgi:hypothetical protein